jgi:fumarylpyruvate hydrolase
MTEFVFAPPAPVAIPIRDSRQWFPVHRIYCVGRNFAEHAKEMGADVPPRGTPVFFMKPADAASAAAATLPYPTITQDLHHEVELVVALGTDADGVVATDRALDLVFGYGVGIDLTRRDLQSYAKEKRLPWDVSKGFDHSAPMSVLVPAAEAGDVFARDLWLRVNGAVRQQAPLSEMVFGVAEVIHELSRLFALKAGDLIFMGTPSGVGALQRGDSFEAGVENLVSFHGRIAD